MSRRKYSYIIYKDGKKERINNWHKPSYDPNDKTMLFFANSGAYLYREIDHIEEPICMPYMHRSLFQNKYEIVKLRGGVHNINVYNKDIWYVVDNIDRFEIVTNFE